MMGYAGPLGPGQLGRTDVHTSIELHRVGVDHLAVQLVRERQGQGRLPGRGRPDDRDHAASRDYAGSHVATVYWTP
jgi:hypothetical protein